MKLRSTFQIIAALSIATSTVHAQGLSRDRPGSNLPAAGSLNNQPYGGAPQPGYGNQGFGGAPAAGSLNSVPYGAYPGMTAPDPMVTAADPNRKLQPGDLLSLRIEEDRELPVDVAVSPSGDVVVEPLPQAIKVTNMTLTGAAQEIKRQLEKDYYHNATVRLQLKAASRAESGYVSISGFVARVGEFPLPAGRTMTVTKAINASGGLARYANERKIQLLRTNKDGTTQTFIVDYKKITKEGQVDLDPTLQDGDRIYVPDTFFK